MKIIKPKLSKYIEKIVLYEEITCEDLVDIEVINQEIDFMIEGTEFNGCKFSNVDFSKVPFKDINLIDCVFEKCNLSGCNFTEKAIHRTRFEKCNLVGCDFIECSISDVSIIDSKGDYLNFSDSKIRHIEIKDSSIREGGFISTNFYDTNFSEVDFSKSEFLNTKLMNIDFSTCKIADIGVSEGDIKGIIVNAEQALEFITLLGIVIK